MYVVMFISVCVFISVLFCGVNDWFVLFFIFIDLNYLEELWEWGRW